MLLHLQRSQPSLLTTQDLDTHLWFTCPQHGGLGELASLSQLMCAGAMLAKAAPKCLWHAFMSLTRSAHAAARLSRTPEDIEHTVRTQERCGLACQAVRGRILRTQLQHHIQGGRRRQQRMRRKITAPVVSRWQQPMARQRLRFAARPPHHACNFAPHAHGATSPPAAVLPLFAPLVPLLLIPLGKSLPRDGLPAICYSTKARAKY